MAIWAGTSGEFDEVPVEDVRRFEREYLDYLKSSQPELLTGIAAKNDKLSDETVGLLKSTISGFKDTFEKSDGRLLRGDVSPGPLDPSQVGQEKITRTVKA